MADSHAEHRHNVAQPAKTGRDLGMLAVIIHVIGDAINNIGVMVVAIAIWKSDSPDRFYADPAVSLFIALMLIGASIPVTRRTGHILLESAPEELIIDDVKHDLEKVCLFSPPLHTLDPKLTTTSDLRRRIST